MSITLYAVISKASLEGGDIGERIQKACEGGTRCLAGSVTGFWCPDKFNMGDEYDKHIPASSRLEEIPCNRCAYHAPNWQAIPLDDIKVKIVLA